MTILNSSPSQGITPELLLDKKLNKHHFDRNSTHHFTIVAPDVGKNSLHWLIIAQRKKGISGYLELELKIKQRMIGLSIHLKLPTRKLANVTSFLASSG